MLEETITPIELRGQEQFTQEYEVQLDLVPFEDCQLFY